ncbi:ABC transporter permease subunit [Horticoccus luteus]|uniref:ABC transporter permease subunit n=1 Tax=Horticoccus luteus TaxID=2862869 RepID=A0A8F9XIH8_9BACT|nr:ABC transporter permease subunit [Horticoccus luteus]QYM77603.1 ABC transporter permease subunit [Horticoccus luteus]
MKFSLQRILLPALTGVLMILVWYAIRLGLADDLRFLLPSPGQVLMALRENAAPLARATLNTGEGALLGFLASIVIGAVLALLLAWSPLVRVSLYPYLMMLQMMPVIVVAPILVLWVGPGLKSVVIVTFLICFFPIVVNATQGLVSADRTLAELFRMYGATRLQETRLLRIPAALPYFFTGLRIAAVLAPIGALVGDYTAGSSAGDGGGLGFQAIIYSSQARYPALFATAAITCVLGFVFVAVVLILSWLALHRWHDSYQRRDL